MRIAVLYYGELEVNNNSVLQNYNRFLFDYDCDFFYSLSDKTHLGSGWHQWKNSELYDFVFNFENTKGVEITHIPTVIEECEWGKYISKNKLKLDNYSYNMGMVAYDASKFSEIKNIKLNKKEVKELKNNILDIEKVFHLKDLLYTNKLPYTNIEFDIRRKYTGVNMIENYQKRSDDIKYDLVMICNVNQILPKIYFEKVMSSFTLEDSIYSFPTTYSFINKNFALGNLKNIKKYSEVWLNLRQYQYFNLDDLKILMKDKSDNPFILENLHYYHLLNSDMNLIHLSNIDINNLNSYYMEYKNENNE